MLACLVAVASAAAPSSSASALQPHHRAASNASVAFSDFKVPQRPKPVPKVLQNGTHVEKEGCCRGNTPGFDPLTSMPVPGQVDPVNVWANFTANTTVSAANTMSPEAKCGPGDRCAGLMCPVGYQTSTDYDECECECVTEGGRLPLHGRVALIIRGEVFRAGARGHKTACELEAKERQLEQARSLVDHVIVPLEQRGTDVDLFVLKGADSCKLTADLLGVYRRDRIAASDSGSYAGQSASVRAALELFKSHLNGVPVSNKYELVMVTRHDILWKAPITQWAPPADFRTFNFLSGCDPELKSVFGRSCVNDVVHLMPANHFDAFDDAAGRGECFAHEGSSDPIRQAGHLCHPAVRERIQADPAFITNWRPARDLREEGCPVIEMD